MKKYLEIIEDVGEGVEKAPQTIRVEVKDIAEARAKAVDEEKALEGKEYTKRFHVCRHEEEDPDRNQPCECEEL